MGARACFLLICFCVLQVLGTEEQENRIFSRDAMATPATTPNVEAAEVIRQTSNGCIQERNTSETCSYAIGHSAGTLRLTEGDENRCKLKGMLYLNATFPTPHIDVHIDRSTVQPEGWTPINAVQASGLSRPRSYVAVTYTLQPTIANNSLQKWGANVTATIDLANDFHALTYSHLLLYGETTRSCIRMGPEMFWTEEACNTTASSAANITCTCRNATKIAAQIVVQELRAQTLIFTAILIALPMSATLLLITIILLVKFRHSLNKPDRRLIIQLNLAISLFFYHCTIALSLSAAWLYDADWNLDVFGGLCYGSALIVLYFELTSVIGMLCEGILIYKKVCLTHRTVSVRNAQALACFVWIFPLFASAGIYALARLPDAPPLVLDSEVFEIVKEKVAVRTGRGECEIPIRRIKNHDFCYPRPFGPSKYAYDVVVATVIVLTSAVLIRVVIVVWQKSRAQCESSTRIRRASKSEYCQVAATIRAVGMLVAMLGTPWLICLLFINFESALAEICFIILQGPILFYLYCVQNHELRVALKRAYDNRNIIKEVGNRK